MTPQIRTVATSPALHISCQGHLIRSSRSNSVAGFQTVFSTTIAHNLGARCLPAGGQTELYTLRRSANSPEQFWVLYKPGWAIPVLTIPCTVQALGEVCRMAEACSHVSLVNQASWKQLEADLRISSQLLGEGDAPLVTRQSADRFKAHGNRTSGPDIAVAKQATSSTSLWESPWQHNKRSIL